MKKILYIIVVLLFAGCGYDRAGDIPLPKSSEWVVNATIADVRALWSGVPMTIHTDIIVSGRVTSSDRDGNYYKTLVIQDNTGAVELKAGLYDMYNIYPPGLEVKLRLKGLVLDLDKDVLVAGRKSPSGSQYTNDYIGYRPMLDRYLGVNQSLVPIESVRTSIGGLQIIAGGTLVTIDDLWRRVHDDSRLADFDGNKPKQTYRILKTRDGADSIALYIDSYAGFASSQLPDPPSMVSVTGILYYGAFSGSKPCFILKPRAKDDIVAQ